MLKMFYLIIDEWWIFKIDGFGMFVGQLCGRASFSKCLLFVLLTHVPPKACAHENFYLHIP
jgi:hypothetical protein